MVDTGDDDCRFPPPNQNAIILIDPETDAKVKQIYSRYKELCAKMDMDMLSESRIRDHINTLEMFGLIESSEKNLGRRGGRTFLYSFVDEPRTAIETFREDARLKVGFPSSTQNLLKQYESSTHSGFQSELGF